MVLETLLQWPVYFDEFDNEVTAIEQLADDQGRIWLENEINEFWSDASGTLHYVPGIMIRDCNHHRHRIQSVVDPNITSRDAPGSSYLRARGLQSRLDISLVKNWLRLCTECHGEECNPVRHPVKLKVRLIDVYEKCIVEDKQCKAIRNSGFTPQMAFQTTTLTSQIRQGRPWCCAGCLASNTCGLMHCVSTRTILRTKQSRSIVCVAFTQIRISRSFLQAAKILKPDCPAFPPESTTNISSLCEAFSWQTQPGILVQRSYNQYGARALGQRKRHTSPSESSTSPKMKSTSSAIRNIGGKRGYLRYSEGSISACITVRFVHSTHVMLRFYTNHFRVRLILASPFISI